MKKKKYLALLLFMLMSIFSLTACVATETAVEDASIVEQLSSSAESMSQQIVSFTDEELAQYIELYGVDGMSPNSGLLSGLTSWESSKDDLGEFVSFDDCKVTYNTSNKNYVATAQLTFEKRKCEFKLIVNRQLSEIEAITFNPAFTGGEKVGKAALNTLTGIGTVFIMLVLISLLIYCFRFVTPLADKITAAKNGNKQTAPAAPAAPAVVAAPAAPAVEDEEELVDDLELVAVITAAIAASMEEEGESSDGLVVRSIKRAKNSKWKRA